jgi:hypothetical protein
MSRKCEIGCTCRRHQPVVRSAETRARISTAAKARHAQGRGADPGRISEGMRRSHARRRANAKTTTTTTRPGILRRLLNRLRRTT